MKESSDDSFRKQIDQWEIWMREGRGQKLKNELRKLNLTKVPRKYAAQVTNFSHRINLPSVGLRLLNPYVRPKDTLVEPATDNEVAQYSVALLRVGASLEAIQLLESVPPDEVIESLLFRGFSYMTQWEYSKAITCFKSFISSGVVTDYQKLTARVNLSASYISLKKPEKAQSHLKIILKKADKAGLGLLAGNSHELMAQSYIQQGQLKLAEKHLELSLKNLKGSSTIGEFFVKKWKTILALKKSRPGRWDLSQLKRLKGQARKINHWETIRDCDLYLLEATKSHDLFRYLIFGTPYSGFRKRIREIYQSDGRIEKKFVWCPDQLNEPEHYIDLSSGLLNQGHSKHPLSSTHHKLLMSMCMDFYRTYGVGHLFGLLFEDEYYNPNTSPQRVYKAIQRFRQWCRSNEVQLNILEDRGQYRISSEKQFGIRLELNQRKYSKSEILRHQLKSKWPVHSFSSSDAGKFLNLSSNTVRQTINDLLSAQKIYSHGKSKNTRYTFSKSTLRRLQNESRARS